MLKLRNILVIIALFVILKYIGQLMKAKRAVKEQEKDKKERERLNRQKEFVKQNSGKTFVIPKEAENKISDIEDVEHEDINE